MFSFMKFVQKCLQFFFVLDII